MFLYCKFSISDFFFLHWQPNIKKINAYIIKKINRLICTFSHFWKISYMNIDKRVSCNFVMRDLGSYYKILLWKYYVEKIIMTYLSDRKYISDKHIILCQGKVYFKLMRFSIFYFYISTMKSTYFSFNKKRKMPFSFNSFSLCTAC